MLKKFFFFGMLTFTVIAAKAAEPEVYNYQIKGMKCGDCIESVKKAVCGLNGVEKCDVTVGKATLEVTPGTKMDQKAIAKAIKDAGHYSVKSYEKVAVKK